MKKKNEAEAPRDAAGIEAWEIPGVIGAELAHHVAPALALMQRLQAAGYMTPTESRALAEAEPHLQRIALTSQQITRLATSRVRHSHERLALADVLRQVFSENARAFRHRGIGVEEHLQDVDVIMDPALLVALLDAALHCAAADGERVQAWLHMKHWPEHAQLTLRSRPHVRDAAHEPREQSLHWIYLSRLADATGVVVRRAIESGFVQVTIEFPRTVAQLAGLTLMEVDAGADPTQASTLAGHHVLLVTRDPDIAWEVDLVAARLRLVLDVVPDCAQAVRFCELETPDMIILDEVVRDAVFDELRRDLLQQNINFPCLEIVAEANVVQVGTWHDEATTRLSRDELRARLQPLLAMELAKVF